jgi:hypothetical protein
LRDSHSFFCVLHCCHQPHSKSETQLLENVSHLWLPELHAWNFWQSRSLSQKPVFASQAFVFKLHCCHLSHSEVSPHIPGEDLQILESFSQYCQLWQSMSSRHLPTFGRHLWYCGLQNSHSFVQNESSEHLPSLVLHSPSTLSHACHSWQLVSSEQ